MAEVAAGVECAIGNADGCTVCYVLPCDSFQERFAAKAVKKAKRVHWDLHAQRGRLSKRHSLVLQGRIRIMLAVALLARKAFIVIGQQAMHLVDSARLVGLLNDEASTSLR